jgi:hypothetical protein
VEGLAFSLKRLIDSGWMYERSAEMPSQPFMLPPSGSAAKNEDAKKIERSAIKATSIKYEIPYARG